MTETRSGKITAKTDKIAKTGAPYWTFTINEKDYNTFDHTIGKEFNVGEFVQIIGDVNDKGFWQMHGMSKVKDEVVEEIEVVKPGTIEKAKEIAGIKKSNGDDPLAFEIRSRQVRVEALKCAIEHVKADPGKHLLGLAYEFEQYILGE